jgi:hypothetical protein
MGKKKSKKSNNNANGEGLILVDPARVRFQHARIRPYFSGCGRGVVATLDEIREGRLKPSDLPPIQVLVGEPGDDDGDVWYFSLNNRRLWVLKRCCEEGLLVENDGRIAVRVRKPKSEQEALRYSVENCALEAKIIPEKNNNNNKDKVAGNSDSTVDASHEVEKRAPRNAKEAGTSNAVSELATLKIPGAQNVLDEDSDDDDSSEDEGPTNSNRFSALF